MRLLILLLSAILTSPALAARIRVPADEPTIQAGIDAASPWDSVLVAPGTYFENLVIDHTVALVSEAGAEVTTIDGQDLDTVVYVDWDVDGVTIGGFRVTQGKSYAGGIVSFGTHTVIRRNIVELNDSYGGAAVWAVLDAVVEGNLIQDNSCFKGTGAAEISGTIERNVIRNNDGVGALYNLLVRYTDTFAYNLVLDNPQGGNEVIFEGGGSIHHNVFARHGQAPTVLIRPAAAGQPFEFHNNIVLHGSGGGVDCHLAGSDVIRCNDVWGSGPSFVNDCVGMDGIDGNFSADPLFCNPSQGDYHLTAESPCAPGNSPGDCELIGVFPVGCGIVAVLDSPTIAPVHLKVVPNPVRGIARIEGGPTATFSTLNIFDANGRLVDRLTGKAGRWEWSPGGAVPAGVYFARPESDHPAAVLKFLYLR